MRKLAARRRDLIHAGVAGGALGLAPGRAHAADARVALVSDPADPVVAAPPARWALGELSDALTASGASVSALARAEEAREDDLVLVVGGAGNPIVSAAMTRARITLDEGPERSALFRARLGGRQARFACGSDARGLMYALLELADRLRTGSSAAEAIGALGTSVERPFVPVRSVMRQFVSEPLDKPWFADREMWPAYLGMLAKHRFNRFHLAFGLGYDTLQRVTDSYMLFLYPFVVDVPGYDVAVSNFTAEERAANLATLRYISEQSVAHGLDFELGIWTHGHELINSANARYHVTGLNPQNHAAYCRDALTALLRELPAVSSVGIRFHGESGIVEGSYDFWRTVYEGVPRAGRIVEIDLHAKGVDAAMIERAQATGMPVTISEKCWAEHQGMTYHQADIRPSERPQPGQVGRGLLTLSEGSLSFTRYGYADLLREGRTYGVRHRVFAGTQRILLSGDPVWAGKYAERFVYCGSDGMDLMEPLTCRGRRGTGIPGTRRSGYVHAELEPRWDWQKYEYWYRVWGRLTYNPQTEPSVWRRHFHEASNPSAAVSLLARASRILPIVTSAHMPSAACDAYWPEVPWNQPMVGEPSGNLYWDTPSPKDFQHVTGHDPQLFSTIAEHADELLSGEASGRYSPLEVASWLDGLVEAIDQDVFAAMGAQSNTDIRRLIIDVAIQAALGRYWAAKFRAGVLFALHERSNDRRALDEALRFYRLARAAYASAVDRARGVYADDLSVSDKYSERGQWADKLPEIDADIARVEARATSAIASADPRVAAAIDAALAPPRARTPLVTHAPPASLQASADLPLSVTAQRGVTAVRCFYRHVNQAERWSELEMTRDGRTFRATIPAAYTNSDYPLQYYFVARTAPDAADIIPGFGADLTDEPYFTVRRG